jgi:hypothetical protein
MIDDYNQERGSRSCYMSLAELMCALQQPHTDRPAAKQVPCTAGTVYAQGVFVFLITLICLHARLLLQELALLVDRLPRAAV